MRQPRLAEMVRVSSVSASCRGTGRRRRSARTGEAGQGVRGQPPSLREALRILENEASSLCGEATSVGDRAPANAEAAAYMLGLVLQGGKVPVSDLTVALGYLEPLCARLCAARSDRRRMVVPVLKQHHRDSVAVIEDAVAFEESCQRFHNASSNARQPEHRIGCQRVRMAVAPAR